jgi:ketosteroid isomerase-like protein
MPPNAALYRGWQTYREYAQPWFDESNIEEKITYKEIEVFGDLAFVRSSYKIHVTPKAGGETTLMNGKGMWILKRQADVSWKGTHCIWNSNYPLTTSEESQ